MEDISFFIGEPSFVKRYCKEQNIPYKGFIENNVNSYEMKPFTIMEPDGKTEIHRLLRVMIADLKASKSRITEYSNTVDVAPVIVPLAETIAVVRVGSANKPAKTLYLKPDLEGIRKPMRYPRGIKRLHKRRQFPRSIINKLLSDIITGVEDLLATFQARTVMKTYKCGLCPRVYTTLGNLRRHQQKRCKARLTLKNNNKK